jgi:hypothetical protein
VPIPLDLPLAGACHERYENDRAHARLRSIVAEAVRRVAEPAVGPRMRPAVNP